MPARELILTRERGTPTETMGTLNCGNSQLHTIERPWIPTDPGGKPRESCVPAGVYDLIPHTRPNNDEVVALVNPGLAVYYTDEERPSRVGRYLILIHAGNWVSNVVGCIAPGMSRDTSSKGPMVKSSRAAMRIIMEYQPEVLVIRGETPAAFR